MAPRPNRLALCSFAVVVASWMAAEALTGCHSGLLYLAPALVLALPLLLGRYVGEEQLVELAARPPAAARRPARRVAPPRSYGRLMRGGGPPAGARGDQLAPALGRAPGPPRARGRPV